MSATIDPSLPLERDVRRLLAAEIEGAIEALGAVRVAPSSSIHAARKRFKKLRALLKLVRSGDEEFYARMPATATCRAAWRRRARQPRWSRRSTALSRNIRARPACSQDCAQDWLNACRRRATPGWSG